MLHQTSPVINGVTNGASYFWQHEVATDEVFANGTVNAVLANVDPAFRSAMIHK